MRLGLGQSLPCALPRAALAESGPQLLLPAAPICDQAYVVMSRPALEDVSQLTPEKALMICRPGAPPGAEESGAEESAAGESGARSVRVTL